MAHLIDMTTGKPAIAYKGDTPWHGLGVSMEAGRTLEQWREAAGLNWTALEAGVQFEAPCTIDGQPEAINPRKVIVVPDRKVLYRSDTLAPLSVVGHKYQPVQPKQIIDFYEELCERQGYAMETMGAIKDGKTIWALAKTGVSADIGKGSSQRDLVEAYLLLYTSFDGSCATTGKFTDVRVVCNNTLSMAQGDKSGKSITVRHNAMFDAGRVKADLGVGKVWEDHQAKLVQLAQAKVTPEQQVNFLLGVYHDITAKHIEASKPYVERTMQRLAGVLAHAPGAQLETASGTLYGLLNAVTYDVDHSTRARSDDSRLSSAWFGAGDQLKTKALEAATSLLETV